MQTPKTTETKTDTADLAAIPPPEAPPSWLFDAEDRREWRRLTAAQRREVAEAGPLVAYGFDPRTSPFDFGC